MSFNALFLTLEALNVFFFRETLGLPEVDTTGAFFSGF